MESIQAEEHLQTIRTLMERSAIYRRALAPIMTYAGAVGTIAAVIGWELRIGNNSVRAFILYWASVAAVALAGSFLLVRRQALKDAESFWSPPTRRVAHALLPLFTVGFVTSAIFCLKAEPRPSAFEFLVATVFFPRIWVVLYGCALHSAGFFTPRGMRLFGWVFVVGGCILFAVSFPRNPNEAELLGYAYGVMGGFFGVLHLAYGIYLYFTEKRKNAM